MTLADLRKLAVRQHLKIGFTLPNGAECVVDERGVVRIPALRNVPDFNAEQEMASAREFRLEPVVSAGITARPRVVSREELAVLTAAGPQQSPAAHEEE